MNGVIYMICRIIFSVIISLLVVFGLSYLIREITRLIFCSKNIKNDVRLILLNGENADIELKIAIEQILYERDLLFAKRNELIIAIDMGLDALAFNRCRTICEDYGISIYNKESIVEAVESISEIMQNS